MTDLIFWNSASGSTGPTRTVGPHQLASWLTKHGYRIKVIDFCELMTTDQLVDITLHYLSSTTVGIGVSSTFWKNPPLVPKDCNRIETLQSGEPDWVIRAREKLKTKSIKWLLGGVNSVGTFTYDWIKFHGHAEDALLRFMDESSKTLKTRTQFDIKNLENSFYDDLHIQSAETLPIELSRGVSVQM